MSLPIHRRAYHAFLSHAHVDRGFVDQLYRWLVEVAGLSIWYDAKKMTGGQGIGSGLQSAIGDCRGMMLVASDDALRSGWVKTELDIARVEQADSPEFRIIPIRVANADVSSVLKGQSWIDVQEPHLAEELAVATLSAFYPGDNRPDPRNSRDVYFSGSWQTGDSASALAVSQALSKAGFRLIGDTKDQKGFKGDRIQSIIESCGAFVCVIPYRGSDTASAAEKPYKYFLTELDLAIKAHLPTLVVADPRLKRTDGDDSAWFRLDSQASASSKEVEGAIDTFWEEWAPPPRPHNIFLATDLEFPSSRKDSDVRRLIERVTGMRTIVGNEIREPDLQSAILQAIREAFLVIADVSGSSDTSFNVDVCIEAGMALATGTNLALVAKGKPRSPPFMLRRAGQLFTYQDDIEQLGVIHSIVQDYRRRIINAELYRY